ncbi:MAG: hypothetical protein K2X27_17550 [Candidatus Obscuribacterales bacterium]|nr:hypothetical protein [Candidatus Obscuribacterales bacterium]
MNNDFSQPSADGQAESPESKNEAGGELTASTPVSNPAEQSPSQNESTDAPNQRNPDDSKPDAVAGSKKRFAFVNGRNCSLTLLCLAIPAMAFGILPAWGGALAALPMLFNVLGVQRAIRCSIAAGSLLISLWQPAWTVFVLPTVAIAAGLAGYRKRSSLGWALAASLLGLAAYVLSLAALTQVLPFVQDLAYEAFCFLPSLLLPLAALVLSLFLSWRLMRGAFSSLPRVLGVVLLLVLSWSFTIACGWLNLSEDGIDLQMRWSMNTESLSELPYTENDRILPRATGEYFVKTSNNKNDYNTEAPHILLEDGNLWWQSPLHNERWYGRILGNVPGVMRIDADKTEKRKEDTGDSSFIFGNNSWVTRAAFSSRHLLSKSAGSTYYRKSDGSWVLLVPQISSRPYWTGLMLPYLSGVMAVDQFGNISDYSVSEAQRRFPGAVFYPPELAAKYSRAYGKWRSGFWGTKVAQSGMMEISQQESNDPGFNPQPYVVHFKGLGLQEVVAFEPQGAHQYALIEVLLFDASTGKMRSYVVPDSISLSGPRRCIEQVRSSDTQTDWSHRRTVEPRLTVSERGIFFLVTITAKEPENPHDQPYITSVLINASSLHSQRFQDPDEMRKFLASPEKK